MFYDFFNFSENLGLKNSNIFLLVSYCEDALTSCKLQILRPNATAQVLLVSEM